jgi:acetyltransferase
VTNAGGPGILATDALSGYGHEPVPFTPATLRRLIAVLPKEATAQNPLDLIASADAKRYRRSLQAVVADPGVHALLVLFVSPIMIDSVAVAKTIIETTLAGRRPKTVVVCLMGRQRGDEATRLLAEAGVPVFRFPEEAAQTLSGLIRYRKLAQAPRGKRRRFPADQASTRRILARHRRVGGGWMSSQAARELLLARGFPVIPTLEAKDAGAAVAHAHHIGYPVCLKAAAEGMVHKSDLGAVRPGLTSGDEVYGVAEELLAKLRPRFRDLRLEVQPMATGHRELLLGLRRDPRFGPVLVAGLGGVTVEVLKDVALRVGPLTDADAEDMFSSLRGAALLGPYRGQPGVDRKKLEECLLRLDQLAFDCPEILEADLNPVIAAAPGQPTRIVDVRVRTAPAG